MKSQTIFLAGILLAGISLFVFNGCESDPITMDVGENGHVLQSFLTNTGNTFSYQDSSSGGASSQLYLGHIDDTRPSAIFLKINSDILAQHADICTLPADSIEYNSAFIHIKSHHQIVVNGQPYSNVDDSLSTGMQNHSEEPGNHSEKPELIFEAFWVDFTDLELDWTEDDYIHFIDDSTFTFGRLEVNLNNPNDAEQFDELPVQTENNGLDILLYPISTLTADICSEADSSFGILLIANDQTDLMEFYSSNTIYSTDAPHLDLQYDKLEEYEITANKYEILGVSSDVIEGLIGISTDSLSTEWGTVAAVNADTVAAIDMDYFGPIISYEDTNSVVDLFTISLQLFDSDLDTTNSVLFYFSDVIIANSDFDPNDDNYSESDTTGTENNLQPDDGELFYDCGIDLICDEDEPGYNPTGTENNGIFDEGELFTDAGIDSLLSFEEAGYDSLTNPDPNGDDYNIDPNGDDWNSADSTGTEGNDNYDSGEIFQDTGSDGIFDEYEPGYSESNPDPNNDNSIDYNTGTEGNGVWDIGEPYLDAGVDNLWSWEEEGFNSTGTEGNDEYDLGEIFIDAGIDSLWSIEEDGFNINTNPDPTFDDYNIDPFGDNWDSVDSTGTENNGILDWTDLDDDGLWDEGEGEEWFDWGVDQTLNSSEQYYGGKELNFTLGNNYCFWNYDENPDTVFDMPDIADDVDGAFWISSITKNDGIADVVISANSKNEVHGIQFQFSHVPLYFLDTLWNDYHTQIYTVESENIFDDISLFNRKYSDQDSLHNYLMIDYSENLNSVLEFNEISGFIEDNPGVTISKAEMTIFIDSTQSALIDDINLYLHLLTEPFTDEFDSLKTEYIAFSSVSTDADSIVIDMKPIMQDLVLEALPYFGFQLEASRIGNNFSHLEFFNETVTDTLLRPRLEILFSR